MKVRLLHQQHEFCLNFQSKAEENLATKFSVPPEAGLDLKIHAYGGMLNFIASFYSDKICMYFVYLIECQDKAIYTGITTDLQRRFKEHKEKIGGHYTKAHPVKKILYTEQFTTRSAALKREAQIKKLSRQKKLGLIKKNSL